MSRLSTDDLSFAKFLHAVKSGSLQQLQEILSTVQSTMVNRIDPQFRQPALYFAALVEGDQRAAKIIKLLIDKGANHQFKDRYQQTILFHAFREGKEKCTQLLLSCGLTLEDSDVYGQTPLFYAVRQNRLEIVRKYANKQLLSHQDKIAAQTPLFYVNQLQMAKLLIEKGANVTLTDSRNKTVVDYLRKLRLQDTTEYLFSELKAAKDLGRSFKNNSFLQKSIIKKTYNLPTISRHTYSIVYLNVQGKPCELSVEEVRLLMANHPKLKALIERPESVPEQSIVEIESWENLAAKIVAKCMKLKGAYFFLEPVNPQLYGISDYFDFVTKPSDLGTIKKKLAHNCYLNADQYVQEMNLLWNNSYMYNGQQHFVSQCAKEIQTNFQTNFKIYQFDRFTTPSKP